MIRAVYPYFREEQVINMIKRFSAFLFTLIWILMLSACGSPAEASYSPALASLPVASAPQESTGPAKTERPAAQTPESQEPETQEQKTQEPETQEPALTVTEDGWYSSKEEVALYIHLYGHLPDNFITKRKAQDMGWSGGSVERYAGEGTAIGGSRFGNYEGLLPEAEGRTYTECDIDTVGSSSRGAKRLVFSNDGLIYYTEDHYGSFELLYGEP